MFKPSRRRIRRTGMVSALVLLAAGAAWAGGSPVAGAAEPVTECFGMPATIIGTPGDDVLTGTPGDDVIVGLEGTDVIYAGAGDFDRVCAGPNDLSVNADGVPRYERIIGGHYLDGGPGLDWIESNGQYEGTERYAESSFVEIHGGGNPTVVDEQGRRWRERLVVPGDADGAEIFGGDGPDRVYAGLTNEGETWAEVDAGAGHDVVNCVGGGDSICEIYGGRGSGNDRLRAVAISRAELFGQSGNDVLSTKHMYGGSSEVDGGLGNDAAFTSGATSQLLRGGSGGDTLTANSPANWGSRATGPHILQGGTGDDYLEGHLAPERFGGGAGTDVVHAGGGNDTVWGGTGYDRLGGGSGRDNLFGEDGNDANWGGPGSDLCRSPTRGPKAHSCER